MGEPVSKPVGVRQTRWTAGIVVAIMLGVVGATFGSWFGSTHMLTVSTEEAAAVARTAVGVSPRMPPERVNVTRPFAYHGDVVDVAYVSFDYDADFGDHWQRVADEVATRLRAAGWTVRTHHSFPLDDPVCVEVAATHGTTAVLVEVCEVPGLGVTVTNTVPVWLMPLTLLGGLVGLALGGLLGAGPIARRLRRAKPPYRLSGLLFSVVALAGLVPGAIFGLLAAIPSWLVDSRFARPFWGGPASYLSNGDPMTFVSVVGLIGLIVTLWRASPQTRVDNAASSASIHASSGPT